MWSGEAGQEELTVRRTFVIKISTNTAALKAGVLQEQLKTATVVRSPRQRKVEFTHGQPRGLAVSMKEPRFSPPKRSRK